MTDVDTPRTPDALDDRARRAREEEMAVRPLGRGLYEVESASGGTYLVDLDAARCTCPDHVIRSARCKHLRRVAIEVTEGRVPPPGKRFAPCSACGTPTLVDDDGPGLCENCALDPGEVVLDRETGDPVIVVEVLDARADEVEIPEAGATVAEYPGNGAYPPGDPVVRVIYPHGVAARADDGYRRRRYAFPRSRLVRPGGRR